METANDVLTLLLLLSVTNNRLLKPRNGFSVLLYTGGLSYNEIIRFIKAAATTRPFRGKYVGL